MAKITWLSSTPPTNRRHGLVYYATPYGTLARPASIPLQPNTPFQAAGKATFANAAYLWSGLTSAEQLSWAPNPPSLTGAYAAFVANAQLLQTWGLIPFPDNPGYFAVNETFDVAATISPTGQITCQAIMPHAAIYPTTPLYLQIYIQVSALIPAYYNGASNASNVGVATPSGYVYLGVAGPFPQVSVSTFDITDAVAGLYPQGVTPPTFDATTGFTYTSYVQLLMYIAFDDGVIGSYGPTELPPYPNSGGY